VPDDAQLLALMRAIAGGDDALVRRLLAESPARAIARLEVGATRQRASEYFLGEIRHHVYAGDTVLHVAAAAYRDGLAGQLLTMGADPGARNRRGGTPLHYVADGAPGSETWNPRAQAATVTCLIEAGADPNAGDVGGVTPLHRAVRNRCAPAVQALLGGGADPRSKNKNGSTPLALTRWSTGRGGAGSPEAKAQMEEIVELLRKHGAA
jgi:ankyrin repeat protein